MPDERGKKGKARDAAKRAVEEERRMQEGRLRQEERKRRRQADQTKHCPA